MVRSAARHSLIYPPLGVWTVKMNLGWEDYLNLRAYRRRCGLKLFELLAVGRVVENMGTEWIWYDTKCGVCPFIYEWAVLIYSEYGILKYPAEWWMTYWGKAITLAGETPCEEEVLNREGIWDRVSQELKLKCPTCYEAVQKEYPRFRDELSSKVTKIINNVRILLVDRYICRRVDSASNRSSYRLSCGRDIRRLFFALPWLDRPFSRA